MASIQCHKPANEPCHQQKCSNHPQTSWLKGNNQTHCTTQTHPQAQPYHNHAASSITHTQSKTHCAEKTHEGHHTHKHTQSKTHCAEKKHEGHHTHKHTQHHHASNGSACHGNTKKKERNLFQRIKDGFSSNDSCSDNSSDSESDNERGCNKRCSKKEIN